MDTSKTRKRWTAIVACLFGVGACAVPRTLGSHSATGNTCGVTLPPEAAGDAMPPPAPTSAAAMRASKIVVEAEIPFARIARELESAVPRRVAEEHGRDIGLAGSLDTTIDRGPFTVGVSAAGDALVVRTSLYARARACTSSRGCYAGCAPEAVATVTAPLALSEAYALSPPRVTVAIVRGCRISALGGLIQVDLTPTIEAQLGPHVRRVEQEIARRLQNVGPLLAERWTELAKPHELPLGAGCVSVHPSGLTQGPSSASADAVRLRFALSASPELRPRCDEAAPLVPYFLPPLAHDATMPDEDELEVRARVPIERFATAAAAPRSFALGDHQAIPRSATVHPDGPELLVSVTLGGDVCGDVHARGRAVWKDDARALGFATLTFSPAERARLEAASVAPEAVAKAFETNVRVAPKITPDTTKTTLPAIVPSLSTTDVELSATVSTARAGDVSTEGEDVVASTLVRGKLVARLAR